MLNINFNRAPKTVITVVVKHPAPERFIFKPVLGEKVIYFHEDTQRFRTGIYLLTWAERRDPKLTDIETSPFLHENMPYCGTEDKQVVRAFVLDMTGDFTDYADLDLVAEFTQFNIDWSHEQNRDLAEREAIERLAAFGEVEAVA